MNDIMVLNLKCDMSDAEIKDCIQQMMPICMVKQQGFCCAITGFDDDPRELWQIPEAVAFMKRLVDLGFISGLEVSTNSEDLVRPEFGVPKLPGFGAIEVWMCAKGLIRTGDNAITKSLLKRFFADLHIANQKSSKVCLEPSYNTGFASKAVEKAQIPDGSVRHGCPKWGK
jgi:hypothetical protein